LEAPERPVSRPGPWSAEEREKLRELILAREQNFVLTRSHFPERSADALRRQGRRIENELSYRTWTQDENNAIICHVRNGLIARFSEVLTARSARAIDNQIRYLHQMGAF
jgi:ABC-type Zn uptake system ZnuABC Zn-binding protein ZnuA